MQSLNQQPLPENIVALILNIGLARNDGLPNNTPAFVVAELNRSGLPAASCTVVVSTTEPTVVVRLRRADALRHGDSSLRHTLHLVSCFLHQDCLAVYDPEAPGLTGYLVGPKAKAWGEFNPALFVLEDGHPPFCLKA